MLGASVLRCGKCAPRKAGQNGSCSSAGFADDEALNERCHCIS